MSAYIPVSLWERERERERERGGGGGGAGADRTGRQGKHFYPSPSLLLQLFLCLEVTVTDDRTYSKLTNDVFLSLHLLSFSMLI